MKQCAVCGDTLNESGRSDAGACMQAAFDAGGDENSVPYPEHVVESASIHQNDTKGV